MDQLRVVIVGCGRMGAERANAAAKLGASVAWLCDTDSSRVQALADKFPESRSTMDPKDIDWHSLDAAFVCVPPAYRGPVELMSLTNNVPLFVEKPVGLNAEQIVPLLDQLKRFPIIHAVGYMNRYRKSVRLARKVLASRKMLGITCAWVVRKYRVPWWVQKELSGGPFNEQATHVVDLYRYLVGEIHSATSLASPQINASDPEFAVAVAIRFSIGALGTLLYNCEAREKEIRLHVFCEEGTLDFEGWDFVMTRNTIDGSLPETGTEEIFVKETKAFLDAVRSGDQTMIECDLEEAHRTQKVVDAIRESFQYHPLARALNI